MEINWFYNGAVSSEHKDGHSVVNINLIRELVTKGDEINFIYYEIKRCKKTEDFIKSLGVKSVLWKKKKYFFNRISNLFINYFSQHKKNPDTFNVFGSNAVLDFNLLEDGRNILIAGDVETRKWSQKKSFKNLFSFLISNIREAIYVNFDMVVLYNEVDANYLKHKTNLFIHPVCYHANKLKLDGEFYYDLLFTGNFNYQPNVYAANYIIENFSSLNYRVGLVGYGANRFSGISTNIIIKDNVQSLEEEIIRSKIYLSPLEYGTGVKNKILSAVNCGTPIVCSRLSIEGIPFPNTINSIIVCKQKNDYVNAIKAILTDYVKYKEEAEELKKYMDVRLSWSTFAINFHYSLEKLC